MADNFRTDAFRGPLMRVSYAFQLFRERENTRDDGTTYTNFGCTLIAPVGDFGPIKDAVLACMKGQWGDKAEEMFRAGLIRNPILAGDGKEARNKETGDINPGLGADVAFIRVASNRRIPIVAADAVTPITDADDLPSGSWGYPVLNAYAWSNPKSGKGVSVGIGAFQLVKKAAGDEILGGSGGVDPSKYFEKIVDPAASSAPAASAASLFD